MKNFKPGVYINQGTFKTFQPEPINKAWQIEDMELMTLLGQAERQLGKLDMFSEYIPNIDYFISMHVAKEATQSSKIEGTKTSVGDTFLDIEDVEDESRDDWEEVRNYIDALNSAVGSLETLPFSSRLIRQTHARLLRGVRGEHKLPGEFRTSQNWIGGSSISKATFVPPVHTAIHDLMSDLEKFAHDEAHFFPDLLRIAMIHYQFETIHPFLDGNGRIGRLMITLFLVEKALLKRPVLYLSDFFEKNRAMYYDNLMAVRERGDIVAWCKFFLRGVIETAQSGIKTFDGILKLQREIDSRLQGLGTRAGNGQTLVTKLYQKPVIDATRAREYTGLSLPTVYKLIESLVDLGMLKEITGARRGKLYQFKEYVDLFQ